MQALLIDIDNERRAQLTCALQEDGIDVLALGTVPEFLTDEMSSKDFLFVHTGDRQTRWRGLIGRWTIKPAILFGGTPPTYDPTPRPENVILVNANILLASDFVGLGDLIDELKFQAGQPAYDWDELRRAANGEGGRRKRALDLLYMFLPLDIQFQIPDLEGSKKEATNILNSLADAQDLLVRILRKPVNLNSADESPNELVRHLLDLLDTVRKAKDAANNEVLRDLFGFGRGNEVKELDRAGYHRRFEALRDLLLNETELR